MTKNIFFLLCLILITPSSWGQNRKESGFEWGGDVRLFKSFDPFTLMFETKMRHELTSLRPKQVTIGSYYRAFKYLHLGAFVWGQSALRWDKDWGAHNGVWDWANTNDKWEYSGVFDATGVYQVDPWPLVLEWKNRFIHNWKHGYETYKTRLGAKYFFTAKDSGRPLAQVFFQYELYFPLNYGHRSIYEKWAYLGTLFPLGDHCWWGPYAAVRNRVWVVTNPRSVQDGPLWEINQDSFFLGLALNLHY